MRKIKVPSLPNNKKFWDKDDVLLHTSFAILVEFFEKEKPERSFSTEFDTEKDKKRVYEYYKLRSLYLWWKYLRNTEHYEKNHASYGFDSEQLKQLASLRHHMWT